ncbi:MAG: hypothetical protein CVU02_00815 [Bacteroidetes bacterium HGW-Bacteroidetes-19]|nr:MAG: hypothetical protein CVU02_00815 [Bacteroidetes bacterium HGW-Bacteroidetes-19]
MKKTALLLVLIVLTFSTFSQKSVEKMPLDSATLPFPNSFIYFLPKTAFKVHVTVINTIKKPGIYANYSEKLIGLPNVIKSNLVTYKIKKIEINDFVIPDSNQQYFVNLSSKQIKKGLYSNYLNSKKSITLSSPNPFSVQTETPEKFYHFTSVKNEEKQENYLETRIIDGVVTQVPVSKTKTITKSLEQEAQEVVELILKIRKDRYALISETHESSISKEALQFMIDEMNQLEKNYLELFIGSSRVEEKIFTFIVVPENENDLMIPVFTFTEDNGMEPLQNPLSENSFFLSIQPQFNLNTYNSQTQVWEANKKHKPNSGFKIRQSIPANVSLYKGNTPFHSFGLYPIYQLSMIQTLPKNMSPFDITKYVFIY